MRILKRVHQIVRHYGLAPRSEAMRRKELVRLLVKARHCSRRSADVIASESFRQKYQRGQVLCGGELSGEVLHPVANDAARSVLVFSRLEWPVFLVRANGYALKYESVR